LNTFDKRGVGYTLKPLVLSEAVLVLSAAVLVLSAAAFVLSAAAFVLELPPQNGD
jgi:hypothetical protein